jgi:hypothetical protein
MVFKETNLVFDLKRLSGSSESLNQRQHQGLSQKGRWGKYPTPRAVNSCPMNVCNAKYNFHLNHCFKSKIPGYSVKDCVEVPVSKNDSHLLWDLKTTS